MNQEHKPSSRKATSAFVLVIVVCGLLMIMVAVIGPFIGLGSKEEFVLYEQFGWTRNNIGCVGLSLIFIGILAALRRLLKLYVQASFQLLHRSGITNITNISLMLVSLLFGYLSVEVAFRVYTYISYTNKKAPLDNILIVEDSFLRKPESNYEHGYRYIPNRVVQRKFIDSDGKVVYSNTIKTNNYGLISHMPTSIKKSPDEFRVVVLGDSLSAGEHWSLPWQDIVANKLNSDAALKQTLKIRNFSVLNFALAGTGIVQQGAFFENVAKQFDPDLVIMSVPATDILRRPQWMGYSSNILGADEAVGLTCSSPDVSLANPHCAFGPIYKISFERIKTTSQINNFRQQIYSQMVVTRINWFRLYPYALAATGIGKKLGLTYRLSPNLDYQFYYDDETQALELSKKVVAKLASEEKMFMLIDMPFLNDFMEEIKPGSERSIGKKVKLRGKEFVLLSRTPPINEQMASLAKAAGRGNFVRLVDTLWAKNRFDAWDGYNHVDDHFTDEGSQAVGLAIADIIRARLLATSN